MKTFLSKHFGNNVVLIFLSFILFVVFCAAMIFLVGYYVFDSFPEHLEKFGDLIRSKPNAPSISDLEGVVPETAPDVKPTSPEKTPADTSEKTPEPKKILSEEDFAKVLFAVFVVIMFFFK